MGANLSTVEDTRTSVASATATPATYPPAYYAPAFSRSYKVATARDYYAASPESMAPPSVVMLPPKAAKTNRILAFHSTKSWRGYLEASKALNNLIVIDFTAAWYTPCRYMESAFKEFAAKYTDVEFAKIDIDDLFEVSRHYGVRTLPTFVLIKKGKMIDKVIGARKEELQRKIEKHRV